MTKVCQKCKLELPPSHKKKYCVSLKHACWCDDKLNEWRLKNNIVTNSKLQKMFNKTIVNKKITP